MAKRDIQSFKSSLSEGLSYPWKNPSRLWYGLWVLIPIIGWLALLAYLRKVTKELATGHTKELPAFGRFWSNFVEGFIILIFALPTFIAMMVLNFFPIIGHLVAVLAGIFLLPWLMVNFFVNETFDSLWEIKKAYNVVEDHFADYLFALLKTLVYSVIYLALSFVLVGIPCLLFGRNYYLAEFYKNNK